ncbi:hypothetical protein [Wukongibacter baidiensis]
MNQYWIEVSKEENRHDESGWGYGKCLWSPVSDKSGKRIYENMRKVMEDDVVIHFYKIKGFIYLNGQSTIKDGCSILHTSPPKAGDWANREAYYKVSLKDFVEFSNQKTVQDFVEANGPLIASERFRISKFFPFDKNNKLNQGMYLCEGSEELYNAILDFTK